MRPGVHYSYGAHERLAVELGNSADRIGDLHNALWEDSWHFTPAERAVFALIEIADDIWDPIHAGWDAGQLLELTAVIATLVNLGRMFDTRGVSDPALFTRPVV